ncbi:MAG: TRAP transporter large permease [Deltaproteobacteria bacterium]|nr:TRAP transporter large permease [Deltaproteobacteria bacterium]
MEWWAVLLLIIGSLVFLFLIGVPVAFAFLFINLVGAYVLWGHTAGLTQMVLSIMRSVTVFALLPVPLFILMGEIMFTFQIAPKMIDVIDGWIGKVPGRLSLLAVMAGVIFATMSGSSLAGCATLGSTLEPEMEKKGYDRSFSLGSIMSSGTLAAMIPPSALGVLLASLAQISVGDFLIAIIIPGLVMAVMFGAYIILRATFQPQVAPGYELSVNRTLGQKVVDTFKYVLPLGIIIFLVIGLIFLGLATPTEAAALGALGCFFLALAYKGWNWQFIKKAGSSSTGISVMMFMILCGAAGFSQIMAFTGATEGLIEFATSFHFSPIVYVIIMQVILMIMGAFMEPLSILMITIPIFMPIIKAMGINPLWFSVLMLINMEMATITPPFGLVLFTMKAVAPDCSMWQIYRASLPFVILDVATIILLMIFPSLVLFLPSLSAH